MADRWGERKRHKKGDESEEEERPWGSEDEERPCEEEKRGEQLTKKWAREDR